MENHKHLFEDKGNYFECSCGKRKLKLLQLEENIQTGVRKNDSKYSVRNDRKRYFFPDEWESFIKEVINEKHKLFFLTLLNTGARVMEALHIKPKDLDLERKTITLEITKQRKAKRTFSGLSKGITFFVTDKYLKLMKGYINKNKIELNKYIFLNNEKLPQNYDLLTSSEKRKYYSIVSIFYSTLLKQKLQKASINDFKQFSLHNIRKTYGNWHRALNIAVEELCYRLGHDLETYYSNYGSSIVFTPNERVKILKILGEVK